MAHGKAGDQPADIPSVVTIIKMEDRLVAIVERRLLDALEAQDLRVKVVVLLGIAHAESQVVVPLDVLIHAHLEILLLW